MSRVQSSSHAVSSDAVAGAATTTTTTTDTDRCLVSGSWVVGGRSVGWSVDCALTCCLPCLFCDFLHSSSFHCWIGEFLELLFNNSLCLTEVTSGVRCTVTEFWPDIVL
ncbi:unnamed protein product [Thelazia callipaeda]|uniref:Secreted protein n=1 Tax=Thelazia callipaeda TaxID=103827 RepID=A0A0N5CYQ3_THECL|nr:unnamed protein product [Thelazia callipaeda]